LLPSSTATNLDLVQILAPDPSPLMLGPDGVIRVGRTRVTLDVVVAVFDAGATPEEIVQQYPSLDLATAYSVVAHVLQHRAEVDRYLTKRQAEATAVRQENERRFAPDGIRQRLLARRSA
jgi:uncharacterized protein (DUF433 family)